MRPTLAAVFAVMSCVLYANVGTVAFAEIWRIESVDPLTLPAPELSRPLVLPADRQRPADKIVPQLWKGLQEKADEDEVALIFELYSPERPSAEGRFSEEWDTDQAELAAAVEHRFALKAARLLSGMRGLSHFPMVFGRAAKADVLELVSLREVKRVYEDERVHSTRTQGAALIKADLLRTTNGGTGSGVGIAILDSGIDAAHPEFAGRNLVWGNFIGSGATPTDDEGHGTAVSGIAGGSSGGMAPGAKLWALKVLDSNGSSVASSILLGLNSAYANRNDFGGLDVLNMSFGGDSPINVDCDGASPYNSVINSLVAAGVAIFAASGNDSDKDGIGHPACHSKVIAVGAVWDGPGLSDPGCAPGTSTASDQITCYSNSGIPLDILAPSACANTPKPGGGYESCFNGTSAAAPYAAGVAAQLLQLHLGTTPAQLRTALMTTGKAITDINGITRNRIDAVAAHQALSGTSPTAPCVQDTTTACMLNNRFRVEVTVINSFVDPPVPIDAFRAPVTGFASSTRETSFFFLNDPNNLEILVKMLDQGNVNAQGQPTIAVLYGLATPLGTGLTITDTSTGVQRTYSSVVNLQRGQTDFFAFVK